VIHLSLANFYAITSEESKAFRELKIAFANKELDVNIKVRTFLNSYSVTETSIKKSEATELLNIMINAHPESSSPLLLCADFYLKSSEYEKARDNIRKGLKLEKSNFQVWQQLMAVEIELSDYKAMYDESKEALNYFPNQPEIYLYNGIAASQTDNHKAAIKSFKNGLDLVIDNEALQSDFYTYMAESYYKLKEYKESDGNFDKALKLNPVNKYVLNNYSYYLSLRGDSLQKAERMSKKCVDMEPQSGTYLDTYGWVLYKMKRYDDAKKALERALESGKGVSAVVVEHYGDILYQLNEKEKAKEQWNRALKLGKGSEFLEQKVKQGILIE